MICLVFYKQSLEVDLMSGTKKRCYQCMRTLDSVASNCPYCGRSLKPISIDEKYLKPGQTIAQRYEIGNILYKNYEHTVYIAYDNHLDAVVAIKEFFPLNVVKRNEDGLVEPAPGREKFFLEQRELFSNLNQTISKFRTMPNIVQIYSVFSENNTFYVITENIKGVFLSEYLSDNYGELSWKNSSPLFIELIKTLSQLHKTGIVHGSISPDAIYVTEDGKFKLTGFLTTFFSQKNEFAHKPLYDGYAAPEQYDKDNDYGSWTDVYSVAAVIYKSLTGTMPTASNTRSFNDNLIAPDILNPNVPKNISLAIMSALTISPKLRTQTMDDLLADLVTPPRASQNIINFNYDKFFDSYDEEDGEDEDKERTKRYIINALSITLSILLIGSLILIFLVFGNDIFGR